MARLLGAAAADTARIGGAIAVNLSGPRRIKAGAARDHFLGVTAVSGRGETFKSGGRVVKNVTGYDLCKVLAGSYGTLAVMTDVTIKVLPRPETEATLARAGPRRRRAGAGDGGGDGLVLRRVRRRRICRADRDAGHDGLDVRPAATAFRLEGFAPSVRHRKACAGRTAASRSVMLARLDESRSLLWRSGARRGAVLGRTARRLAAVARLDLASARPRVRGQAAARRAMVLRLGRRPDLGGAAAVGRRRRRARSAAP